MNSSRLIFTTTLILIFFCSDLYGDSLFDREVTYSEDVFSLSPVIDIPVTAAGTILFVSEMFIEPVEGPQQNIDEIIFPDRYSIFEFDSGLDTVCDILFISSLLLPTATIIGADFDGILETGVMFIETMLLTWSVKDIIKDIVPRYRPYTYLSEPLDDDYLNSFPSGHTAAAFAVSSFTSYVFVKMYPDSEWGLPVTIGSFTIATAMAVLRVLSGNHFISDVVAGAFLGSAFGVGIPMLHTIKTENNSGLALNASLGKVPSVTVSFRV